ncbi:MAG TPA: LLM class flavin-dependent oxidoreductase [Cellulomonas sp.]
MSLEFGVAVHPGPDHAAVVAAAMSAQTLGFDRFWFPDQGLGTDPFVMLTRLAAQTRIDLGLALTSPFSRHPVQIARAMASVVQLDPHPRDWVLGLGKGNSNLVLHPLGLDAAATPGRLIAAVDLVRRLLHGETVLPEDEPGGFLAAPVTLESGLARCAVYLGSRGPQTLRRAAGVADGYLTESMSTPGLVAWAHDLVTGPFGPPRPHVAWQSVQLLDAGQPMPARARRFAAMLARTTSPDLLDRLGVSDRTRAAIAAGTLTAGDLPNEDVRRFVVVGTPTQVVDRVLAAHRAGATGWSSILVGDEDPLVALHRFARHVMAPVRAELGLPQHRSEGGPA